MASDETAKALNDLARHQMIKRLLLDILADLAVCEIEGWDKMEFITMLQHELDTLGKGKDVDICTEQKINIEQ